MGTLAGFAKERVVEVMQLDELMEQWARWGVQNGSRNVNIIGRLMEQFIQHEAHVSSIPYGVDRDGVMLAIDRVICAMPPIRRQVVVLEYTQGGTQEQKARRCCPQIGRRAFQNQLLLAHAQISNIPSVKRLLDMNYL